MKKKIKDFIYRNPFCYKVYLASVWLKIISIRLFSKRILDIDNIPSISCKIDISDKEDYIKKIEKIKNINKFQRFFLKDYTKYEKFYIWGYCETCRKMVPFLAERNKSSNYNWRETIVCPVCKLNNRMRYMVKEITSSLESDSQLYVTEQVTSFYKTLSKYFPKIVGSEYINSGIKSGVLCGDIRHEDITDLSFEDDSFDCVVSCDVLEHVANYKKAITEVYRVLKKEGRFIFSVPFNIDSNKDSVRAIIVDGEIEYLFKPEYHGNPINNKGSLVFTIPGWEMIDFIKTLFSDIKIKMYYSTKKCHFVNESGIPQFYFVAKK